MASTDNISPAPSSAPAPASAVPAAGGGATRLDLAALTRHRDVAAPTEAIPALAPVLPPFSPSKPPGVTYDRETRTGYPSVTVPPPRSPRPSVPAPAPAQAPMGERDRQRERARLLTEARDRAETEKIEYEAGRRAMMIRSEERTRRHRHRMERYAEARAIAWTLFGYACLLVIVSVGSATAGMLFGVFTPPWIR